MKKILNEPRRLNGRQKAAVTTGFTASAGALAAIILNPSVNAQDTSLAHLTFRTCLIPETETFRLFFRADYVAGEYRIVGQNTGTTINLGYLDVGETGGGFTADNTTYVLPEDTWLKQWYNGERWQRAGGIPVTDAEQHTELEMLCEVGDDTPYTDTPYVTVTPTPTVTTAPITTTAPTPVTQAPRTGAVLGASTQAPGRVLGASTLSPTGVDANLIIGASIVFLTVGIVSLLKTSLKLN